ncbi:MAG: alpha/beta hydrolase [Candidatus Phytoplasma sp.]|nr:alpha/beta hydrolase [Phytoplasma sp.]
MIIRNQVIYTKFTEIKDAKATVIITHGIAESSEEYEKLANDLQLASYQTLLYDVRGHGRSMGKRGDIKSFHQFLDDLHEIVKKVRMTSRKKVYLLGHSMGGIITNAYVVKYKDVDGVIISAAPTDYLPSVKTLRKVPYRLLNFKKIKTNFKGKGLSRIPYQEKYYPYHLDYIKPRLIGNILISSIKYLHKNLENYQVPVLFLHGKADPIVPYQLTETFYNKVMSEDKDVKYYNDSLHNLFNDLDAKIITSDVISWLDQRSKVEVNEKA